MNLTTPTFPTPRAVPQEVLDRRSKRAYDDSGRDNLLISNTPQPKEGTKMPKISTPADKAMASNFKGREAQPNPYLPHLAALNDGKRHDLELDEKERASTELQKLRAAADTIGRSVRVSSDWTPAGEFKEARSFGFMLVEKITRERKPKEDEQPAETVAAEPATTVTTKKASKKS